MKSKSEKLKPWLFMGVGNVLFNEDPAYSHIYLMMYQILQQKDESMTFEKLLNDRDELIKNGHILPLKALIQESLTEEEQSFMRQEFRMLLETDWIKFNPLNRGVKEFLEEASQHFHLGIIANGPAFLRAVMQEAGIMKYLKVAVISEEIGIPKPNKRIFTEAINQAREYCMDRNLLFDNFKVIMVGDSLEQDIVPANTMNMITIQLYWDLEEKYKDSELLKNRTFTEYLDHLKRYSSRRRAPAGKNEKPAWLVKDFKQLLETLLSSCL